MRALWLLGCAIGLGGLPVGGSPLGSGTAWGQTVNACGCYRDDAGACRCTKKNRCGCPEECEPVGCEQKRQRQAEREADLALKRIAAEDRKKAGAAARASRKKKPATSATAPSDPAAEAIAKAAKKAL